MSITLLIIDPRIDEFIYELQEAFERADTETLAVRDVAGALVALARFDFDAVLVGEIKEAPERLQELRDACGLPVVRYAGSDDVRTIVQAATQAKGHGRSQ